MATFSTERLKQLVSYSIQGAGFNKLIELVSFFLLNLFILLIQFLISQGFIQSPDTIKKSNLFTF